MHPANGLEHSMSLLYRIASDYVDINEHTDGRHGPVNVALCVGIVTTSKISRLALFVARIVIVQRAAVHAQGH